MKYQSFDKGFEVRGVFLDILKAFDIVWHEGLIYKLTQSGVEGNLLDTLTNFLSEKKQRVVLNNQNGQILKQGSLKVQFWDHYFCMIYINDLPDILTLNPKLFADDTSLFSVINDKHSSTNKLNQDLNRISNSAFQWKMSFNPDPSKPAQEIIFSCKLQKSTHPPLSFNNSTITQSVTQKH